MTPSSCKICGIPHHGLNHVWNKSNEPAPAAPTRKVAWNKPRTPVKPESFPAPCPNCSTLKAQIVTLEAAVTRYKSELENVTRYKPQPESVTPVTPQNSNALQSECNALQPKSRAAYMRARRAAKKIADENGK